MGFCRRLEGAEQLRVRAHAGEWYRKSAKDLTGLSQTKAQQRSAEAAQAAAADERTAADAPDKWDNLQCREPRSRAALLARFGGNEASEVAVDRALGWLERHQNADGSWKFDRAGPRARDPFSDPGTLNAPNAATAVAVLGFLGADNGPREGKYRVAATKGLKNLKARLAYFGDRAACRDATAPEMPTHALATIAVCETAALGRGRDRQWQSIAQAMVDYIVATQDADGGWSNKPVLAENIHAKIRRQRETPEPSTMLATGWTLMALRIARWADADIPDKTFQRAVEYLNGMAVRGGAPGTKGGQALLTDPGAVDYRGDAPGEVADPLLATLFGTLGRLWLTQAAPDAQKPDWAVGVARFGRNGPSLHGDWTRNFLQGILLRQTSPAAWRDWSQPLRDHLIATQQATDGQLAGSWFEDGGGWQDRQGGRLFSTAMGALILELYYRYPP